MSFRHPPLYSFALHTLSSRINGQSLQSRRDRSNRVLAASPHRRAPLPNRSSTLHRRGPSLLQQLLVGRWLLFHSEQFVFEIKIIGGISIAIWRDVMLVMVHLRRLHVVVLLLFSDLFHDDCNAFTTNLLPPTSPQAFRRQFHPSSHHIKRRCPSISPSAVEMTSTTEGGSPKTTILPDSTSSRLKRTTDFLNWAMANDIKYVSSC
jgi:hypothetical protein